MRDRVNTIIESDPAIKKLSGPDLKNYLIGAINKYFLDNVNSTPLVQLLLQEVSSKGAIQAPSAKARDQQS